MKCEQLIGPASGLVFTRTLIRAADPVVSPTSRWEELVRVDVEMAGCAQLSEIVDALRTASRLARGLNRRQQQCHQDSDDRNYD